MSRTSHSVQELEIMAYLDGELSRERAAGLAAHLEQCQECQTVAADLRGVSQELAGWQIDSPSLQINPRIKVALEDYERKQKSVPQRRHSSIRNLFRIHPWRAWSGAAAAVLLVMAVMLSSVTQNHAPAIVGYTEPYRRVQQGEAQSRDKRVTTGKTAPRIPAASVGRSGYGLVGKLERDDVVIPTGPMVVRTAQLTLTVTEFDQARARMEEILERHGGYLGQLSVSGSAEAARTLEATLRVPADQLAATLKELKDLGRVDAESQQGDEVSQQYVDLQARLLNSRNEEQRLIEILRKRTGKLADVLAVEQEIASVREEIERMQTEKKVLEKQVAFSAVTMKMNEDYKQRVQVVPDSTSTRIRNAAVEGYQTMVAGLINVLVFLASWGPSLLLWAAILFFPIRWLWKRRKSDLF